MPSRPKSTPQKIQGFVETPVVFANWLRVSHSQVSFQFDFGRLGPTDELDGPHTITSVALIAVPAQFIPHLLEALQANVKRYESQFGPIQQPALACSEEAAATKEGVN